jgi:hypothetical protein
MILRTVVLTSCLILTTGSCTRFVVQPELPCPDRPELMPLPVDLQLQMPVDAIWIVAENQLALKSHIQKLESRLGCGE